MRGQLGGLRSVEHLPLPFSEGSIHTVQGVNRLVKEIVEGDARLRAIAVQGEVSNFKHHSSGHMYFTLKDEEARLRCVMFRGRNQRLRFRPENGISVVACGSIGVYATAGDVQLYVDEMFPDGLGRLYAAFEALKTKLEAEGLFDPDRKLPLPPLPRRVGVVTSPTGAAVRDIISVLQRRFPGLAIVVSPAVVQGEEGPASVVAALDRLQRWGGVDVVIVGRGGGSLEELWTFNDERVARALALCPIPVISAVGHETDFTIADFAADRRAPTPSAAAELVVPEKRGLQEQVVALEKRLIQTIERRLRTERERLHLLVERPVLQRPYDHIAQSRQQVDELIHRAELALKHVVQEKRGRLRTVAGKLEALSPLATLARGYAVCATPEGRVLRRAQEAQVGDPVAVQLWEGELACRIERVDATGGGCAANKGPESDVASG